MRASGRGSGQGIRGIRAASLLPSLPPSLPPSLARLRPRANACCVPLGGLHRTRHSTPPALYFLPSSLIPPAAGLGYRNIWDYGKRKGRVGAGGRTDGRRTDGRVRMWTARGASHVPLFSGRRQGRMRRGGAPRRKRRWHPTPSFAWRSRAGHAHFRGAVEG